MCFRREPRISNGPFVSLHVVRAFYLFIGMFGAQKRFHFHDGIDRLLCHVKMFLSITRSNTIFSGQLQNTELRVNLVGVWESA